jgi:fatty acid amide hydrolase 2
VDALLDMAALDLAAAIRAREVTPLEVVDAHIARLQAVNPLLNALVADRFEAARSEARAAAESLTRPDVPPLLGVPCTVKEFWAVDGLPCTGGLTVHRDRRSTKDAPVVANVRAAGAIPLGVTNAPEGGLAVETYNPVHGRTNNPWDLGRTCGGSSGGEGALVAAGASPFGVASDLGGSIRLPAAFCGVVGHKPTGGLVPNGGHFPPVSAPARTYLCGGPIVRHTRDLWPLLEVFAGGPVGERAPVHAPADLRGLVVYTLPVLHSVRVRASVRDALTRSAAALADRGASVRELPLPRMRSALRIWSAMVAEGQEEPFLDMLTGTRVSLRRQYGRYPFGRADHTLPALFVAGVERALRHLPKQHQVAAGRALQAEIEEALGPRGVLLHPPYSRPAPRHLDTLRTPLDFVGAAIFNVLELPVTEVPVGVDARGLPLGVQVAAMRGNDALTIEVASVLEATLGGWRRAEPRRR